MDLRERLQTALGSAYTIERELGGGGMSRVYVAEETALGRKVVVKVLRPELAAELSAERFEREVRLAAQLQHPQIVPVLTAGDADGVPYYTMPLVEGESLRAQLAQSGPLPVSQAVSVLRDVAKALEFAHARGIVHRDIKPDNVLLAGSSAAVTDFGIAKALSASKATRATASSGTLTQLGTSIGTPSYMAPEQAAGDPETDHRADIYAFGCMAYELLTGSTPFGDKPPHQQIVAHFSERPVPVEQRRPDVPRPLADLVMRCLAKAPAERPQSATGILSALDAATTGTQAAAAPSASRRRAFVLVGAVAALAAAVAATVVLRRPTTSANDQVIAILPFRVAGADPSLQYLREGMIDLLSAKLEAGGGVRAVDSRTLLAAWRKAGGTDRDDVPEDKSRGIAANLQAGGMLMGDIVGSGKQVTVHAALVNTKSGKRADATASGSADSLQSLVDRVAAELLTKRAGEAEQRLGALTSTSLPALRSYLDGQANYRRGRWPAASAGFNAALDADTTFGLAALGVLQTSGWFHNTRDLGRSRRIAWRSRDRFSPRDRALVEVLLGPKYPQTPALADVIAAAERYTVVAPDSPDAWYHVGDWYFHYGRGAGIEDAPQKSLNAFSHALELDSTFTPALEHLPQLYAAIGDSAKLRRSIALLAAGDSGYIIGGERLTAATQLGDSAEVRRLRAAMPQMSATTLYQVVYGARAGVLGLDDARTALAKIDAEALTPYDRSQAAYLHVMLESDLGHPAKAADALSKVTPDEVDVQRVLFTIFWDWDSTGVGAVEKRVTAQARAASTGPNQGRLFSMYEYMVAAEYAAWLGDAAGVGAAAEAVRQLVFPNDSSGYGVVRDRYLIPVDAQAAAMEKRPDAARLLARADSVLKLDPSGQLLVLGNMLVARGWEAVGDPQRAFAALKRSEGDGAPGFYYSTLLRERGRLAARVGNRDAALGYYRQFLALRANADPQLKPLNDQVAAEVKRLEATRAK